MSHKGQSVHHSGVGEHGVKRDVKRIEREMDSRARAVLARNEEFTLLGRCTILVHEIQRHRCL